MLTMLRYLDLSHTKVRSLPKGLGNLTRLRYLDLRYTNDLTSIPAGVISRLVKLQVLDLFGGKAAEGISIEVEENDGEEIEEISSRSLIDEVEHLPGGLKGFGVALRSADAFKQLSNASHVFTWCLRLEVMEDLSSIQLKHNMWSDLESLELSGCREAMELEFVADEGKINDTWCPIIFLYISGLEELTEIILPARVVPSVFFQRLRDVTIDGCGGLKNINWILGLQSLAKLSLRRCEGMECLVDEFPGKEEDADEAFDYFPRLRYLSLDCLRGLRCICGPTPRNDFPNLEFLIVEGCPNLKKFPFPTSNGDKLKVIHCDREWWDGLEVEESIKNSLEPRMTYW